MEKKHCSMFLAFFPFSEIVCLISVIMAWLYIGLGIIGNYQAPEISRGKSISFCNEVQSTTPSISKAANCFWFEKKTASDLDSRIINNNYKALAPILSQKYSEFGISVKQLHFNKYQPNRAPPAFS